jgi:hypothetical protein
MVKAVMGRRGLGSGKWLAVAVPEPEEVAVTEAADALPLAVDDAVVVRDLAEEAVADAVGNAVADEVANGVPVAVPHNELVGDSVALPVADCVDTDVEVPVCVLVVKAVGEAAALRVRLAAAVVEAADVPEEVAVAVAE